MKTRKLFQLMSVIEAADQHRLLSLCEAAVDKRYAFFKKLLLLNIQSADELSRWLETQIKEGYKKEDLRRILSFCTQEIERQLLLSAIDKDGALKAFLLAQTAIDANNDYLLEHYLKRAIKQAEKTGQAEIRNNSLSLYINQIGRRQKAKDLSLIRQLVLEKKEAVNQLHFKEQATFYRLLSGLYLDDAEIINITDGYENTYQQLEQLAKNCPNEVDAIEYKITKARFAFFDPKSFPVFINDCIGQIKSQQNYSPKERDLMARRLHFLQIVNGFHFGSSTAELLQEAALLIDIDYRHQLKDSISYFYYLLILFLEKGPKSVQEAKEDYHSFFYNRKTWFYWEFIDALILLEEKEPLLALQQFSELVYAPNFYISLWSRFCELQIHMEQQNHRLCNSLLDRIRQVLVKNDNIRYTYNSSRELYRLGRHLLAATTDKPIEVSNQLSPFHRYLVKHLHLYSTR